MQIYTLSREIAVGADIDTIWSFLSNPRNLDALTPSDLDFTIVSRLPDQMYDGLLIEYRIRLPMIGTRRWLTEIKHIREKRSFVDEQRVGPYKLWYHYHQLSEIPNGSSILDEVRYTMPFSLLGRFVHFLLVNDALKEIFDFRESKLLEIFGKPEG